MARRDSDGVVKVGRATRRREGSPCRRFVGVGRTRFGHPCAAPRDMHGLSDDGAPGGCGRSAKTRARAGGIRGIRLAKKAP